MSGFREVRLRGHNSVNVDQSPERASVSSNALESTSIRNRDITIQERERDARLAPQVGSRSSSESLNSGGTKESENSPILPLTPTNFSARKSPFVPRLRSWWPSFWTANRGIILVILAMFFGATMGLTTRLLELESKDHKRMQPIQVGQSTFSTKLFDLTVSRYCSRV